MAADSCGDVQEGESVAAATGAWRPILTGADAGRALEVARDIAGALQTLYAERPTDAQFCSVADGRAGAALFHAYLGEALSDEGTLEAAVGLLEAALDGGSAGPRNAALYEGFTGIAWTLAHLSGRLIDLGEEDPNEAVDGALIELLSTAPWPGEYDLISGLVGIGVYALERLPRPTARACLEAVIDRLAELAEQRDGGVTWKTAPALLPEWQRALHPSGYHNLGVAHGVPGIIALLGKACGAMVAEATARPLLDGAVAWLLAQRLPPDAGACFPSWIAPDAELRPARSAWCYGDPGVAAALLVAARSIGQPAWEAEAIAIGRRVADRPVEESGVVDAGICHGAAGLAHLLNRLYQATDEQAFGDAARHWLRRALAYRRLGTGVGGFAAGRPGVGGERGESADSGFLEGAAGVGLALLAAAAPVAPDWDRILLLS
jgi:lantibiotic modifying enzyme